LSFYLDAFLFFGLGAALFEVTAWIEKRSGGWWNHTVSTVVIVVLTAFFESLSVLLYFDDDGTSVVYKFLRLILPIDDPNGGAIMLHSYTTGMTKAAMPSLLVILLYALYPAWVYLGYRTAQNLFIVGSKFSGRRSFERSRRIRFASLFGVPAGGCFLLFGAMRFPGGVLRQSNLAAFCLTMFGIGIMVLSLYGMTSSSSENKPNPHAVLRNSSRIYKSG
jgi:hypothetical protein